MAEETAEPKAGFKTALVFAMLFAVLGAVVVIAFLTTFRQPVTTLILIRHAEKIIDPNNSDPDLSPAGQTRAQEIVRMFGDAGINALWWATNYAKAQGFVLRDFKFVQIPHHGSRRNVGPIRLVYRQLQPCSREFVRR